MCVPETECCDPDAFWIIENSRGEFPVLKHSRDFIFRQSFTRRMFELFESSALY